MSLGLEVGIKVVSINLESEVTSNVVMASYIRKNCKFFILQANKLYLVKAKRKDNKMKNHSLT